MVRLARELGLGVWLLICDQCRLRTARAWCRLIGSHDGRWREMPGDRLQWYCRRCGHIRPTMPVLR